MKKATVFISLCLVVIVVSGVIAYLYLSQPITMTPTYEELRITGITFQTGNATISVMNIGTVALSISSVRVDYVTKTILATGGSLTGSGPYELACCGARGTITISLSWTSGNNYTFMVITTKGNGFFYRTTAP